MSEDDQAILAVYQGLVSVLYILVAAVAVIFVVLALLVHPFFWIGAVAMVALFVPRPIKITRELATRPPLWKIHRNQAGE